MSTKTEHLGLHQWEPEDSFLRTDFNEDFAKIDAGVGLLQNSVVSGSFVFPGGQNVEVDLGFRPRMVVMVCGRARSAGILMEDAFIYCANNGTSVVSSGDVETLDNGFRIYKSSHCFGYDPGVTARYLAFR